MPFKNVIYPLSMARNKRDIDAQVKRDEIVGHALDLFRAHGFDATSMAMISRAAGIAPNTIYWYFAGKDEVLLAVADQLIAQGLADYRARPFRSMLQRLTWLMARFSEHEAVVNAIHTRVEHSPAVREWHDRYHLTLEAHIVEALTQAGHSPERAQLMATVGTFVVEGLLSHPHSSAQRKTILAWLAGN